MLQNLETERVEMVKDNNECKERRVLKEVKMGDYRLLDTATSMKMSIDCGSTETRVLTGNKMDLLRSEVVGLESDYGVIGDLDISPIVSKSSSIYDNLEMEIHREKLYENGVDFELFNNLHIVKGRLVKDVDVLPERITSDQAKSSQDATYVNIVSNVAVNLLLRVMRVKEGKGKLYNEYGMDITVGLRTDDTSSSKRMENFKKRLEGRYTVCFPRMNTTVNFSIDSNRVFIENEGNAVIRYWATVNNEDSEKYKRAILIDGGGSSLDYSFLLDGYIVDKGCHTGLYGGARMLQSIIEQYVNNNEAEIPSVEMVSEALPTGLLQNGNDFIDITTSIKEVKIEYAKRIIRDLEVVCQKVDTRSNQLNLLLTSGRLFNKSKNDNTKVAGLHKFIEKLFKKKNSSIVVDNISDDFALVWGLAFFRESKDEI